MGPPGSTPGESGPEARTAASQTSAAAKLVAEPAAHSPPPPELGNAQATTHPPAAPKRKGGAAQSALTQAGSPSLSLPMPPKRSGKEPSLGTAQSRATSSQRAAAVSLAAPPSGFWPLDALGGRGGLSSDSSTDDATSDEEQAGTANSFFGRSGIGMSDFEQEAAAQAATDWDLIGANNWQPVLPKKTRKGRGQPVVGSQQQHRALPLPAHFGHDRAAVPQQHARLARPLLPPQLPRGIPPERTQQRLQEKAGITGNQPLGGSSGPLQPLQLRSPPSAQAAQPQPPQQPTNVYKARVPNKRDLSPVPLPDGFAVPACLQHADLPPDVGKHSCPTAVCVGVSSNSQSISY